MASASGNGKTTFARALARALDVRLVELDLLVHGPGWAETPDDVLRAQVEEVVASDGWVVDGVFFHKLGDLVLAAADTVVWLDLPVRVWLPRLTRRTCRRIRGRELLSSGNSESLRTALWGRDALIPYALRSHVRRRRSWPEALRVYRVVRLQTQGDVDGFLAAVRAGRGAVWAKTRP